MKPSIIRLRALEKQLYAYLYANDIALQVDEWRRENGIPFDKSTIAASPSEVDGGEFDTMDEALRYLYTCLNFPDSVLC